ncbi:Negative elongation factor B [Fukomys damarensis]|uniref:Negative elongation factor B n=1 Tax=Fukomys damarensis TaxID=885580 RepID=A0A091CQL5_FUKDA|nr:Negative elongation factor B [Fukomys damarensis]
MKQESWLLLYYQDLGVANGEDLKETLTNCTEPLKAIEQFQTENGVLLPSLQSALPFLDLHGTPRLEFHQSVFDELRDKLLERVSAIASEGKAEERYKKLEDLLEKSFSLVKMPSLQPVVMCVMKHLPKVPEKKLKLVMADKELYRACAVEVKRQIWQDNQALFGDEVSPLLKQYILEKENALFSTELSVLHNFFSPSPKTRRQGEVVQKLTQMVGKNVKLYDMVLQFLRTLFLRTRNVHYCTLRAELLMSLHDLDVGDICTVDPCHKFTWCLDACIRERFVDSKRARELQGFLDGVKKGQEQVLGDLSMILCDPFAINTLSLSTIRHLQELVSQETLPRDSPDLLLLLRLLALGQGAWDLIDSQVFKEPKMEVELITKFLPMLMSFVVDDYTFNVDQKLPSEEKAPVTYPNTLPESFTKFLQEQRMACEVGLYYVLHITKQRNKNALLRLLPGLVETFGDLAFSDIFLHLLTGSLALLADEFALEDFCSSLFEGFFLTASPSLTETSLHSRWSMGLILEEPWVPEKKLKLVMADKELYRACAVEVKRQIWQDNQALFGDEVSPLLKQYILEKENALFSTELSVLHNFFSPSPKTRRQGEVVQKLTQMVGKNVKLYDMVLQFLRTLFLRTRNVHYCTLRAELLMSLHDLDVGDICTVDPCHKFTWCLDACIRERFVDSKRARELQGFLDGVKKGQEQVLGDLSMILCDPFAINTLSLSTIRHLQELVSQETLPRDSPDLLLLLRLLALGQGAWDLIDSQVFKEPKMEVELITKFLPMLMSFVVDDYTFNVDQKLPSEEKAPVTYPNTLPESFTKFLQEQRMACEVGLYYVLHITKQRNKNALLRLLPGLVETFGDLAFSDIFLHLLTGSLALLADEFALEDFCSSLFEGFFLTASPRKENVHRHVLRLLLHLHARVAPSKLEALQKALEPTGQSGEAVKELYSQLGEKLEQLDHRKPSPAQAAETPTLELPLPSMPAAAGL